MKELNSKAIDPNCGLAVNTSTNIKAEQNGKQFYFCSDHCMQEFLDRPSTGESDEDKNLQ